MSIADRRLSVLSLAEELGNASEACRRTGVNRTSFYDWKRRYELEGVAGLSQRRHSRRAHPHKTPTGTVAEITALALAHPASGCDRIAAALARSGKRISGVTIQKILHKSGLGTVQKRWLVVEEMFAADPSKATSEQLEFLEKQNPCLRERSSGVMAPAQVLAHCAFFLGKFDAIGAVYVHALLDAYSCSAFGMLGARQKPELSVGRLVERALPHLTPAPVIRTTVVLTGPNPGISAEDMRGIEAATGCDFRHAPTHGFAERFKRDVQASFLRRPFSPDIAGASLDELQDRFDAWLVSYNTELPHQGYPNHGRSPRQALEDYASDQAECRRLARRA